MTKTFDSIAVVGAGNIGASVTIDLLLHGHSVSLIDIDDSALLAAHDRIRQELKFAILMQKSRMAIPDGGMDRMLASLTLEKELAAVSGCSFIIENVFEEWSVKEEVYRKLDALCPPQVCFGVNTSCISIAKIAAVTHRPEKVVGVHFMNPVYLKRTVEVMRSQHTSDDTLAHVFSLLGSLDKEGIVVNDSPGFVSNRISHLFMNEAAFVFQDNVASARDIDEIFKKCFSHRMGPLETADLIGLDTVMRSIDVLYESYGDSKFICCPLIRQMVLEGRLGRKTGKGFYDYTLT